MPQHGVAELLVRPYTQNPNHHSPSKRSELGVDLLCMLRSWVGIVSYWDSQVFLGALNPKPWFMGFFGVGTSGFQRKFGLGAGVSRTFAWLLPFGVGVAGSWAGWGLEFRGRP